jgi:hypothetical protein
MARLFALGIFLDGAIRRVDPTGRRSYPRGVALDFVIRGGTVITPQGVGPWDVGVLGERIAVLALPGTLPTEGARVVDATGRIVAPAASSHTRTSRIRSGRVPTSPA